MPVLTRRRFLRDTALGVAGLGLARFAGGCGDNATPVADLAGAVFEPSETGMIVSVWAKRARSVTVAITRDADGSLVTLTDLELDAASGLGALEVDGLEPDAGYAVTLAASDAYDAPTLHARTAPVLDATRPVRLAVSADVDPSPEFDSDIWTTMLAAEPELYISIGDFPYTDNGPIAQSVDEYRQRHLDLRTSPKIREFMAGVGIRAIYDDHEYRNNWDAHFVAAEPERYAAAVQVWDEFFPLARATGDVRYRSWRWGANVECFMLDCRRFRSANAAPDDAGKTMLGATQRRWLLDALHASTATWKLVLTSVPLDFGTGDDHWHTFATERDAIFAATLGLSGLLFLSADQHWFAAHRHAHGIREIQMGPVARGLGKPDPAVPGVLYRNATFNFALVEATAAALTVTGIDAGGTRFYSETWTAADLTPKST